MKRCEPHSRFFSSVQKCASEYDLTELTNQCAALDPVTLAYYFSIMSF